MVPPQPISMSSQWAPKQRIRIGASVCFRRHRLSINEFHLVLLPRFPYFPGSLAARVHVVERLFFLKCIHARPEPIVFVREQLLLLDQPLKRLLYKFFPVPHIFENVLAEQEISSVHQDSSLVDVPDSTDEIIRHGYHMKT